jgi:alginate O-acetyltransferase complex protein AlgI
MPFNSILYLVLLAVAVLLYWVMPPRYRRVFVLAASLAFYATWGLVFVGIPLLVAGLVYFIGRQIQANGVQAKKWAWTGTGVLLVLLGLFKYRFFVIANLNFFASFLGTARLAIPAAVAFPVGISFYTFEAIAFLIDVRQKRVKMPGFFELCLFFLFWPNILSGPIVRARELVPQLSFQRQFEARYFFEGLDRLIWGLVQKNVVANMLGVWVDNGFAPAAVGGGPSTVDAWFLAIAFGLQIYFDFAAYTNMAIGTARLLGVTLPENFRQPYHAATPPEFWSRWHMTLSRWIRDYLFFPINARWKGASLPLFLSLLGVMALVGLWHGAGWGFILWGFLHGTYLVVYRIYESWRGPRAAEHTSRFASGAWRVITLVAITAAWVPFRAPNLHTAGSIMSAMFYRMGGGRGYSPLFYAFTAMVVAYCAFEPMLMKKLNEIEGQAGLSEPSAFRVIGRPLAYVLGLVLFILFDERNVQFIYSQF